MNGLRPEDIACPEDSEFRFEYINVTSGYPGGERETSARVLVGGICGAPAGGKCRPLSWDGRDLIEGAHGSRRAALMNSEWERAFPVGDDL